MSKKKNDDVITGKDLKGNEVTVLVVKPSPDIYRDSQTAYNKAFREALESGALLRQKLTDYMEKQGIWDDTKQKAYDKLLDEINAKGEALQKGGIPIKDAREVALSMRKQRGEFRSLIAERSALDTNSVEGQADNARFNALICLCVLDPNTKKPIFQKQEDYDNLAEEPWAVKAAGSLANMIYEIDPNYDANLTENKFLVNYDFANEELRLVNADGHLIAIDEEDGTERLINEGGRYVAYHEDGTQYFINMDGEEIDQEGEKVLEFSPFLDDSGKPIPAPKNDGGEEETAKKEDKPKATRASKKKVESS